MTTIVQLSSDLINKIAAGEVVERPSSVVKELVENALDAGAKRIEVELEGGGRDRIRVTDDGRGMTKEDAALCIERHATSKLRDAEGLFQIESFGFRGEAVPAIASVSRLSLVTRVPDAVEGTRIEIEGGRIVSVEACGAPAGTTFEIRDLFFATPARRKFLKRPETEASHAAEALVRLALARPDVGFTLRSGGRISFQSPATEDPKERIAAAIGKEIFPHLLPVEARHGTIRIRGYAGSPAFSAPSTRAIYTFVNGRFIRDRQLLHAIQRAYEGLLPSGRSPGLVVFIDLPPSEVDVNVHPQKLEVRFAEPRAAYDALYRGLSEALSRGEWLEKVEDPQAATGRMYSVPASPQPVFDWRARYRSLAGEGRQPHGPLGPEVREAAAALWPRPGDGEAVNQLPEGAAASLVSKAGPQALDALRPIGTLRGTFLLCEAPEGDLIILDLHAIRERLAWERLDAARTLGELKGPPFLFPVIVDVGASLGKVLLARGPLLLRLGVEVEPFGGTNFALKAVPAELVGADYDRLLHQLCDAIEAAPEGEGEDAALAVLACLSSSLSEHELTQGEGAELLDALSKTRGARRCIHDSIVVSKLPLESLERRAGR